ncbi:aminoglycoside phosphotransferase family protein [Psychrobacillus vulpis]|uniref:Aminoglycoside phosphotransferase family protein n=1 Tax=Psychrobacillus vulpis TaxID=2325572 RepID=A0A544TPQ1_9BACI|nr:aminoglycoside phosphotransferase family protein [Psychrobacillus vulpis]TQR19428.1 aminoglycoside phosphotransferase family protein [Psychrobacillus vulpis]
MDLGSPIAMGNTAKIYLWEDRIIKIFNDYLPVSESLYEANKQKFAYSCGLSVPKILDVTEIDGKQAIIMEYINGRTIGDILSENMQQAEYYMGISIDVQQKIHLVVADPLEPMTEKLKRQIEVAPQLDERHKSSLLKKLESMVFEKRLCHGDFHLYNLIMSNNEVTIIDWVDSSAGDIRADVYRTYLLYSQFSMELANMYLRLYCDKSGLSMEGVFQWAPIIAGARLSENVSSEKSNRLLDIVNHYCP